MWHIALFRPSHPPESISSGPRSQVFAVDGLKVLLVLLLLLRAAPAQLPSAGVVQQVTMTAVHTFRTFVGSLTGPLTRSCLLFARSSSSLHTFSSEETFRLVRVIRILWIF